ncbi:hypothetical protein [Propionivibrio limicola]|uniref:hypothetical protein n=1 Tax=Propionivibrio limicola TaxID=167645 RepID=UPI001FE5112C|nr:hypothetical protein [Propionivibrio limicola]
MPDKRLPPLQAFLIAASVSLILSGCDAVQQKMGIEDPIAKAERENADGKAVGGACRQSGRAIEDCYSIYSWLPKASIYEGWRDMDAYMRENNLETIAPQLPPVAPPSAKKKTKKIKKQAAPEEASAAGEKTDETSAAKNEAKKH